MSQGFHTISASVIFLAIYGVITNFLAHLCFSHLLNPWKRFIAIAVVLRVLLRNVSSSNPVAHISCTFGLVSIDQFQVTHFASWRPSFRSVLHELSGTGWKKRHSGCRLMHCGAFCRWLSFIAWCKSVVRHGCQARVQEVCPAQCCPLIALLPYACLGPCHSGIFWSSLRIVNR